MAKGIDQNNLDKTTTPGEDFYQFVNGGWMAATEIPPDRSSWGSFHELSKDTEQNVIDILDTELSTPGASENIAARFFETAMDIENIEKTQLQPIQHLLGAIDKLTKHAEIPGLLGLFAEQGSGAVIHFSIHPDLADSHKYAAYIEAANLGLPEREYYLDEDNKAIEVRNQYTEYIELILQKEGGYTETVAKSAAKEILSLEKILAINMMTKEDRRQMDKLFNPRSAAALKEMTPEWDWDSFFKATKTPFPEHVIVTELNYLEFINKSLYGFPLKTIQHYLKFIVINGSAPYAHQTLEKAHFNFYSNTLQGIEKMRPRKERLVNVVNQSLGEALGQLYVSKHFPLKAKEQAVEMVGDIVEAFKPRFKALEWMEEKTKTYALEKLDAFKVKIGYPDTWKSYAGLQIKSTAEGGSYLENIQAIVRWKFKKDAARVGKEVDKHEWFMAPQQVNAYYNPMFNEIVFPAAILQPPFFDWKADAAVNYGGIGAVIGHEITHGFDDQGSRFDKSGNLKEWWTAADRTRFNDRTKQLIAQFDQYYPFEDLALNGTFTLGENIADLGGLSVAFDALQLYYKRHPKPDPIDGYTAEQRFFMSWATVWRTKTRPEALRNQIKTDPHPPGLYRAIAAPSNMESFYKAFDILIESKWFRTKEDRIKIW